jgi:hypothetical protein
MAENCAPRVYPEALIRTSLACETRNLPYEFDVEKVCGITLTTTYAPPVPTNTAEAASDCDVSNYLPCTYISTSGFYEFSS